VDTSPVKSDKAKKIKRIKSKGIRKKWNKGRPR